jgi:DNA polymerase-4
MVLVNNMERVIAHSDCNCFYASVEMLRNPRLRDVPMAVCGNARQRHGIVLTANYIAKKAGVKTGMANWQAREVCPGLYIVDPCFSDYKRFSGYLRELYGLYSDRVESFGLDECWIDLSGCVSSFDDGARAINEIRNRTRRELGLTVSIGLSDNKIFAKLGSDIKKPDACTVIPKDGYKEIVWPLPVRELLYIGGATESRLAKRNIRTIGELAQTPANLLYHWFGKTGPTLSAFANGGDKSPVVPDEFAIPVKSISNSHTCPRDLYSDEDVKVVLYTLAENVSARLMEKDLFATVIEFSYCTTDFKKMAVKQRKLDSPMNFSGEIAGTAFALFKQAYGHWPQPLRKVGVRAGGLVNGNYPRQLSLWQTADEEQKTRDLETTINSLRSRLGNNIVQRGIMMLYPEFSGIEVEMGCSLSRGVFQHER